ncbi:hypothetical protein [Paenirhodobacter sp.]|uniref:hypothetical protein n=1 Tax=Paenirhodobacter sp. TaxID=1965326 RepID=UPI003B4086C1
MESRRFPDIDPSLAEIIGFDSKWAYTIIKTIGNHSEIHDRNLTPPGWERGRNPL